MPRYHLPVTLTLTGPFLTKSTILGEFGIDAPMARDSQDRVYLSGNALKGLAREAAIELRNAAAEARQPAAWNPPLEEWFGDAYNPPGHDSQDTISTVAPSRAALRFHDLLLTVPTVLPKTLRYRIQQDHLLGAVNEGSLQVIESPFPPGSTLQFHGNIEARVAATQVADLQIKLQAILRTISALGALRSIGGGRLTCATVAPAVPVGVVNQIAGNQPAGHFWIALTFDAPLCVSMRAPVSNTFESEEVIPGGVLKGALASAFNIDHGRHPATPITAADGAGLPAAFEQLRISHAFPSADGPALTRPVKLPLSLAIAGDQPYDLLYCNGPGLLHHAAPTFAVDWKPPQEKVAETLAHWPSITKELRVRTAIDSNTRRAKDEQLFAYRMVVPGSRKWLAQVDLSGVTDPVNRAAAQTQLLALLRSGLSGIGKTKVNATIEVLPAPPPLAPLPPAPDIRPPGFHALTLQTAALLGNPTGLTSPNGSSQLFDAYRADFTDISKGVLTLVRYFAQQAPAGGFYLFKRFQSGNQYRPWMLTEAGSVFLLQAVEGREEEARALVATWAESGLPLPAWVAERHACPAGTHNGDDWSVNPYIPQNGYGQVAVDLPVHYTHRPGGAYHAI